MLKKEEKVKMDNRNCHCSGYATRNDLVCGDGRTIRKDAFKDCDGATVPLIYNHDHNNPDAVLGHALLENRNDGVYAYLTFNETEQGQKIKECVEHGDVRSLSIYANRLKQIGNDVVHGVIRELSVVLAGANPGAYIDWVMAHDDESGEALIANYDETGVIAIYHSSDSKETKEDEKMADEVKKEENPKAEKTEKTVKEVFDEFTEEQKNVVYAMIGAALEEEGEADEDEEGEKEINHSEGGNETMKQNAFDKEVVKEGGVLTHADQEAIIDLAKQSNVGSLKRAIEIYAEENDTLKHSEDGVGIFEDYGVLFPELELLKKGEPETLYKYDQSWVAPALNKIHKSPFSRIRTRHADARLAELKAKGYQKKGDEKTVMGQIKMINRETTPQTIYIKDSLHRDDIVDITDFSIVDYQWKQMRRILDETMILAAMVGDNREEGDPDKISEEHIRPIWKDNDEYTIHHDVDIAAAKTELQGSNTGANFGENYIYAEAIITAALYSRERFKGTGTPDFYCTPHLVNVMLLARDLNGRRIYDSKADLAKALNCNSIVEVEQFEGLVRTTEGGDKKKLLGLFVNLNDYTFGSTRGGEITKFEDFDMDFNLKKFMLETRLSGSLYKLKSAIALEEPVTEAAG
jgi:hypothetical protein